MKRTSMDEGKEMKQKNSKEFPRAKETIRGTPPSSPNRPFFFLHSLSSVYIFYAHKVFNKERLKETKVTRERKGEKGGSCFFGMSWSRIENDLIFTGQHA